MNRACEVWESHVCVVVVLEEDKANAYAHESICFVLVLDSMDPESVGRTTGQWLPRESNSDWRRIA